MLDRKKIIQNKPIVSVICPVYNTNPQFLHECITSVLEQTYRSFELILVDDNSQKKETLEVLNSYVDLGQTDNIKVIHNQDNKGISESRNIGIDNSHGKYIAFIDHDDMYEKDFLEVMVRAAEEQNYDYVCCEHSELTKDKKTQSVTSKSCGILKTYQNELVWQHIYLRDFILKNNIRFHQDKLCEDIVFSQLCNLYTTNCIAIDYHGYINRIHNTNTSRSWIYYSQGRKLLPLESYENIAMIYKEKSLELDLQTQNALQWIIYKSLAVCVWIYCCKCSKKEKKYVSEWVERIVNSYYKDINVNMFYKHYALSAGTCTFSVWNMAHLLYNAVDHRNIERVSYLTTGAISLYLGFSKVILDILKKLKVI